MRPLETNKDTACSTSPSNDSVNSSQSHHCAMPSRVSLAAGAVSRYRRMAHASSQTLAAAASSSTGVHPSASRLKPSSPPSAGAWAWTWSLWPGSHTRDQTSTRGNPEGDPAGRLRRRAVASPPHLQSGVIRRDVPYDGSGSDTRRCRQRQPRGERRDPEVPPGSPRVPSFPVRRRDGGTSPLSSYPRQSAPA